jgi:hypothetical protein
MNAGTAMPSRRRVRSEFGAVGRRQPEQEIALGGVGFGEYGELLVEVTEGLGELEGVTGRYAPVACVDGQGERRVGPEGGQQRLP